MCNGSISNFVIKEACPLKGEFVYFSATALIRYRHMYLKTHKEALVVQSGQGIKKKAYAGKDSTCIDGVHIQERDAAFQR